MKWRDRDWHLHQETHLPLAILGFFVFIFGTIGIAGYTTGWESTTDYKTATDFWINVACLFAVLTPMVCLPAWFFSRECASRPWMAVMGTRVECKYGMLHMYHLNRDGDPIWRWIWDSGIPDRDVHLSDNVLTFRTRSQAAFFKMTWG